VRRVVDRSGFTCRNGDAVASFHLVVLAYHGIFTAYGFWLPNDPRGSWSDFVGAWELVRFGKATTVTTHRSLARVPHDRSLRLAAKEALKYPPVTFDGRQALSVSKGIAAAVREANFVLLACSILPDHVHLVFERHRRNAEQIMGHMKAKATMRLREDGNHPLAAYVSPGDRMPTLWTERSWKVYLDSPQAIRRAINYVEQNPVKERKPIQNWSFVQPFGG
jgi:REP element-mobilizing transposase RayT